MAETFSQNVRLAASEMGMFTVDELVSRLPVSTYREKRKIRSVIQGFEASGEAVLLKPGIYRYQGRKQPLSRVARMWRAIRIKGHFTRLDLVRLTGASKGHAKKYIFYLKRKGFIELVSKQGNNYGVYRLIDPDNAPLEHPQLPGRIDC